MQPNRELEVILTFTSQLSFCRSALSRVRSMLTEACTWTKIPYIEKHRHPSCRRLTHASWSSGGDDWRKTAASLISWSPRFVFPREAGKACLWSLKSRDIGSEILQVKFFSRIMTCTSRKLISQHTPRSAIFGIIAYRLGDALSRTWRVISAKSHLAGRFREISSNTSIMTRGNWISS